MGYQPSNSVARVWPTSQPCKGSPSAPASAADGLDRTCCPAFCWPPRVRRQAAADAREPNQSCNVTGVLLHKKPDIPTKQFVSAI